MPSSDEARKKRAESRSRRRKDAAAEKPEPKQEDVDESNSTEDEPLHAVKQAAKVAAVGAAVGAATAAARALTQDRDEGAEDGSDASPAADESEDTDSAEGAQTEADESPEAAEPSDGEHQRPQPEAQADDGEEQAGEQTPPAQAQGSAPVAGAAPEDVANAVSRAREQLEAVLERKVESVSEFQRTSDGWLITFEVVEVSRIPESTDVLASYEIELDDSCSLRRYVRRGRYIRSQPNRQEET